MFFPFMNEFKQNFDLDSYLFPLSFNSGPIRRQEEKHSTWNTPRLALPPPPAGYKDKYFGFSQ